MRSELVGRGVAGAKPLPLIVGREGGIRTHDPLTACEPCGFVARFRPTFCPTATEWFVSNLSNVRRISVDRVTACERTSPKRPAT